MENMEIYNKVRKVPEEAKKPISAGRLKGYTDINPQWRIQTLTEMFGACGFGWYYDVINKWTEGKDNEICAFVDINLYVKADGEWSKPIHGSGGSKLVTNERNGMYVSDEAYKMATTDAISVACKQLGVGADVYWSNGRSKYIQTKDGEADQPKEKKPASKPKEAPASNPREAEQNDMARANELMHLRHKIYDYIEGKGLNENAIAQHFGKVDTVLEWDKATCDVYVQYVEKKGNKIA